MYRIVKTKDFKDSEWDCHYWGLEKPKPDDMLNLTIMHAPRKYRRKLCDVAARVEEEKEEVETTESEEDSEDDESSDDGDALVDDDDDTTTDEKVTLYSLPYEGRKGDMLESSMCASNKALDLYNKEQGTKYIFSSLVKVIVRSVPSPCRLWVIFCVKFEASTKLIPRDEDDKVIFHSKVLFGTRMGQFNFPVVLHVEKPVDPKFEFDFEDNKILDNETPDVDLHAIHPLIRASIDEYNNHKNTNYSYKSLTKVSRHLVCGTNWWVYHIWFMVSTDPSSTDPDIDTKVFEAKVLDHKTDDAKVVMVVKNRGTPTAN